jgi:NADPH:quinone reductase-like Zn-dependent oxidoreductase
MFLNQSAGPAALTSGELPRPVPGAGEVLVRVHATAVTPTEFQWYPTFHLPTGEPRPFPIVLGHEFSGTIESIGPGGADWRPGDEVFGMNGWFMNGAQAEYCLAPATALAGKPRLLSHPQAAVAPISALTAWQGLLERARLGPGERVLIHGAAGGVGVFAVQLARWRGAHVIATASAQNRDLVRQLGAREVIDYQADRFDELAGQVDVVFDPVGGDTLARSWRLLKPGGRLVTVATCSVRSGDVRVREAFMFVRPEGRQLAQIARLMDAGELRPVVRETLPLAEAATAYTLAQPGGGPGKIALHIAAPESMAEN